MEKRVVRGLVRPTLSMLAALAVLIGLGTWQLQRKSWKEGLLADIAQRTNADPIDLQGAVRRWNAGEDMEYTRVRVRGTFRHDKERYLYAPGADGPGVHVYTPMTTSTGAIVFVNRGYVPDRLKDPLRRAPSVAGGEVELTGLLRAPGRQGPFTPDNDLKHHLWYWRDLAGMANSALGEDAPRVAPFFLDAEAGPRSGWPRGGVTRLDLPNRHLEYALTWFGLAGALIGVYLSFAISCLRSA